MARNLGVNMNFLAVKTQKEKKFYYEYTLTVYSIVKNTVDLLGSTTYSGGSNCGDKLELLNFLLKNKKINQKNYDLFKNCSLKECKIQII